MIVTKRKTIEVSLLANNLGPDKLFLGYSDTGFITGQLFDEWCEFVLKVRVLEMRKEYCYDGVGVILVDGCTVHSTSKFKDICVDLNLCVFYLPPHSSNQTQPLDLGLFHVHKSRIRNTKLDVDDSLLVERISAIYHSWQSAATSVNITSAWEASGAVFTVGGPSFTFIRFGKEYASKVSSNDEECKELKRMVIASLQRVHKTRLPVEEYNLIHNDRSANRTKGIFESLKRVDLPQNPSMLYKVSSCFVPLECISRHNNDENQTTGRPKKISTEGKGDIQYGRLTTDERIMLELEYIGLKDHGHKY
jgi:hypothetical protein